MAEARLPKRMMIVNTSVFIMNIIFCLLWSVFGFPVFLQMSVVSPSNVVVVNGRPNIAGNLYICLTLSDIYNTIGRYMSDKRQTLLKCKYKNYNYKSSNGLLMY